MASLAMNQPPRKILHYPRRPFVGLALAMASGIICADLRPQFSWLVLAALALFLFLSLLGAGSIWTYALIGVAFFLLHGFQQADTAGLQLAQELGDQQQNVAARGFVMNKPTVSISGYATFVLQLTTIEFAGQRRAARARIFVRSKGDATFGDELELFGSIAPISPPRNPGEFDLRSFLARHDIYHQILVTYSGDSRLLRYRIGNPILRAAQSTQKWMETVLERSLEDSPAVCGLITGMVLGLRHQGPDDIEEPFQQTGTLHLFAVAGLHVGIIARLLWIVATVARLRQQVAVLLIMPALLFYAAITELHTSSVRAALMSSILLGGLLVERKVFTLNNLAGAAVLILCWDTNELFSLGFQLSFCVVAAIVMIADPTFSFFRRYIEPDPFLPRHLLSPSRRFTAHLLWEIGRGTSVSFAAWIGSLPLMLWYYNLVTPISLLANLIVVPIAFLILAGGLLSIIAAPFSTWLSIVCNNANWALARIILGIVYLLSQLPGGHFYTARPGSPKNALAEITVLDLGTGSAIHIRAGTSDWLFDTGRERDFARIVQPYLRSRGINWLDGLLLTHGDSSHVGGASRILNEFRPQQLVERTVRDRSPIHRRFLNELARKKIVPTLGKSGDDLALSPSIRARILFPPGDSRQRVADDQTFVVQLFVEGRSRALFMSDSGEATERALLKNDLDLRSDIIIKGQHCSGISGSPVFLDRVQPQLIVATSRDFPNSERITDEWMATLQQRGIKLFRQDQTGAVQIRFLQTGWEATAYLTSEIFRRTRR